MKRFAHVLVTVLLAGGFLFSPFQHVHAPGRAESHIAKEHAGSLALHFHLEGREVDDSVWQEAEETARTLSGFVISESKQSVPFTLLATAVYGVPTPEWSGPCIHFGAPPVHDPPDLFVRSPRGPPA